MAMERYYGQINPSFLRKLEKGVEKILYSQTYFSRLRSIEGLIFRKGYRYSICRMSGGVLPVYVK